MSARYFLDTNVFVYSFDRRSPGKQRRSIDLIHTALSSGEGVISTQVVQEFLNVATRKFRVPMKAKDARVYLRQVLNPLCQVFPDLALYESCLEIQKRTKFSFYDSLILAAGISAGCSRLYSEDLQANREIDGIEITNPYIDLQPS